MRDSWTHGTERYRYASREDNPAFTELLSDAEVGRWLWFTPMPRDRVRKYFGPLLDRQAMQRAAGETPRTAVFAVEDLSGAFLGQGAVVAVEASPPARHGGVSEGGRGDRVAQPVDRVGTHAVQCR